MTNTIFKIRSDIFCGVLARCLLSPEQRKLFSIISGKKDSYIPEELDCVFHLESKGLVVLSLNNPKDIINDKTNLAPWLDFKEFVELYLVQKTQ